MNEPSFTCFCRLQRIDGDRIQNVFFNHEIPATLLFNTETREAVIFESQLKVRETIEQFVKEFEATPA